jgi:hypothetical protein
MKKYKLERLSNLFNITQLKIMELEFDPGCLVPESVFLSDSDSLKSETESLLSTLLALRVINKPLFLPRV